jgi:hypothetical protein
MKLAEAEAVRFVAGYDLDDDFPFSIFYARLDQRPDRPRPRNLRGTVGRFSSPNLIGNANSCASQVWERQE